MTPERAVKLPLAGWLGHALLTAGASLGGWWKRTAFARGGLAAGRAQLERLDRLTLSPQHSIHLVRVAGRALLLGVSPAGIQVLARFSAPEGRPIGGDAGR